MKKYLFLLCCLMAKNLSAQTPIGPFRTQPQASTAPFAWDRASTNLYIDYSYLNNDNNGTRWHINDYYTAIDSSINFIGVAYDNICGYYDYVNYSTTVVSASDLGFASVYPADALLRFDSLQAFIAHENNSGMADTIIAELRELNANNTISSTVLWADTVITSVGLSPGNSWSNGAASFYFMRFPVNYSTTAGQKAGAVMRYLNYNKQDTFGLAAGFVNFGLGGNSAVQSNYKNSFLRFPPFANSIIRNSDFVMNLGGYLPGQNWSVIPRVEVYNTTLGLLSSKGDLHVLTVYPNPSNGLLNLAVKLEEQPEVTIRIVDKQGKVMKHYIRNTIGTGVYREAIDCSDLASGLYTVVINQQQRSYSQRIIIGN